MNFFSELCIYLFKPGYFDSTAASGNCQGTGGGDGDGECCKLIEVAVAVITAQRVEILLRANG